MAAVGEIRAGKGCVVQVRKCYYAVRTFMLAVKHMFFVWMDPHGYAGLDGV